MHKDCRDVHCHDILQQSTSQLCAYCGKDLCCPKHTDRIRKHDTEAERAEVTLVDISGFHCMQQKVTTMQNSICLSIGFACVGCKHQCQQVVVTS